MAGLVPVIPVFPGDGVEHTLGQMRAGWVYFMTNRPNGTLYTGVTADLSRRIYEHREGLCAGFTKRYALTRFAWYEFHDDITAAIQRESNMKHWPRVWKVRSSQ